MDKDWIKKKAAEEDGADVSACSPEDLPDRDAVAERVLNLLDAVEKAIVEEEDIPESERQTILQSFAEWRQGIDSGELNLFQLLNLKIVLEPLYAAKVIDDTIRGALDTTKEK